MTKFVNRKELALLLEVSVFQVRSNEKNWGLVPAKRMINQRCVRYVREIAEKALKERGLI